MSLIKVSIPAKVAAAGAKDAQDANGDEVIAQKNGCKLVHNTLNDGYWFYTKSGAGWALTATNKVAAVNEFNRLVNPAKDSADVAQDSGDYTTNATALLKMAYENLNKAERVVRTAGKNISDGKSKVKDGQTKSFLDRIEHEWWSCEKEIYEVIKELRTIAVPSSYGVPHKEKLSPEDRNIIAEFFKFQ